MLGRAMQLLTGLVLAVVVVSGEVADVTTPAAEVTPTCRDGPRGFTCVFVNVVQEVVVGDGSVAVAAGVASHPVTFPCPVTLDVTNSSINITKRRAPDAAPGPSRTSRPSLNATETNVTTPHVASPGPSHAPQPPLNTAETTEASVTTSQAVPHDLAHAPQPSLNTTETSVTAPLVVPFGSSPPLQPRLGRMERAVRKSHFVSVGSGSPKLRNILHVPPRPPQECIMNVSARHSTFQEVRGQFDVAQFENSKIVLLDGKYYGDLVLRDSEVTNISLVGETVTIQDTKIELISHLTAKRRLDVRNTEVGRVVRGGLLLSSLGQEEARQPHYLSHVTVGQMEARSLLVTETGVKMDDVSVDVLAKDAIIVQKGGVLNLTRVALNGCKSLQCLTLHRGARVIITNSTFRNRTINTLDLQPDSRPNMYPLLSLVSTDDYPALKVTFDWYWVILMGVCGVVAGLVIGSAVMWRRKGPRVSPASTFTLADLLSHDQLQEGGNTHNHVADTAASQLRPSIFTRQDSGLTSSSFGSFANFQTPPSTLMTVTTDSNSWD